MRLEGWEGRLSAAVAAARNQPFEWGVNDCALLAAKLVQSITGTDLAEQWRGYSGERGAVRVVREAGGLAAIATQALGEPVNPRLAQRGDVVLLERDLPSPWTEALGVCVGTHAVFASRSGLAFAPMPSWSMAWRVR